MANSSTANLLQSTVISKCQLLSSQLQFTKANILLRLYRTSLTNGLPTRPVVPKTIENPFPESLGGMKWCAKFLKGVCFIILRFLCLYAKITEYISQHVFAVKSWRCTAIQGFHLEILSCSCSKTFPLPTATLCTKFLHRTLWYQR